MTEFSAGGESSATNICYPFRVIDEEPKSGQAKTTGKNHIDGKVINHHD